MLHRLRRLGSLALLLALVGGGLGLPLFDAVVFHSRPLNAAGNRIAPEGAATGHTQLCILDQAGLATPSIGSAGHEAPAVLTHAAPPAVAPAESSPRHNPHLLPRPRAPPVA